MTYGFVQLPCTARDSLYNILKQKKLKQSFDTEPQHFTGLLTEIKATDRAALQ